jgi:polysaccharide export outer membrane protein
VLVAGQELQDAEREICAAGVARGIFRSPTVTVTMKQPRTIRVTVVGSVKTPNVYELPRGAGSVLAAIVAAGGLADDAGPDVEVRHTQAVPGQGPQPHVAGLPGTEGAMVSYEQTIAAQTVKLSLSNARVDPRAARDLQDGDVVQVPRRVIKGVYVMGLVAKPGELPYPVNQEIRLLDAISMAGGCSHMLADQVTLIRHVPGKDDPVKIDVSIEAAKTGNENLQLAPGDTVVIEQTPAVLAFDLIKTFFRFGVNIPLF